MDYMNFVFDTMMSYIALFIAAALYISTLGILLCDTAGSIYESHKKKQYAYAKERKMHNEHQ